MKKRIECVAIVLWLFLGIGPALSQQPTADELLAFKQCPPTRDIIYFGNGINNTLAEANLSKREIIKAYSPDLNKNYPDQKFQFCVAYNYSRGFEKDVIEVLNQKADETGGLTAVQLLELIKLKKEQAKKIIELLSLVSGKGSIVNSIALGATSKAADAYIEYLQNDAETLSRDFQKATTDLHVQRYFSDLCMGNRVAVVAHSQGNLFANEAAAQVINRHKPFENSMRILGVASPANREGGDTVYISNFNDTWPYAYVTAHDDRAISALRSIHNILPSNLDNDVSSWSPFERDLLNHGFISAYLDSVLPSRGKIDLMLNRLVQSLHFPNKTTNPLSCVNQGAISITVKDKDTKKSIPRVKITATHPVFGFFEGLTNEDGRYTFNLPVEYAHQNPSPAIGSQYQLNVYATGWVSSSFVQALSLCAIQDGFLRCFVPNSHNVQLTLLLEKSSAEYGMVEVKRVGATGGILPNNMPTQAQVDNLTPQSQNSAFFDNIPVSTNPSIAKSTDLPQYREKVAVCATQGCTLVPNDPNVVYQYAACNGTTCEIPVSLNGSGQLTRVVFLYDECANGYTKAGNGMECTSVIMPPPPPIATGKLNDTGITVCANNAQNGLPCPVSDFPGQDAEYGRDALAAAGLLQKVGGGSAGFDFTKLDDNGNPLPASATEWSCVKDNHTGLIWEEKTTSGLRSMNNTYTWYNPDISTNGGHSGAKDGGYCSESECDTRDYVRAVNMQGLCGANDWRMPTRDELHGIVDYSQLNPAIDTDYFPHTKVSDNQYVAYWSATPSASNVNHAWIVYFSNGNASPSAAKTNPFFYHVRLVRGGR